MLRNVFCVLVLICATSALAAAPSNASKGSGAVYYVSSSTGNDSNDGLSIGSAFRTIGQVNSLNLQPSDKVLFKCGDTWHAEMLVINKSGTASSPIVFGSYPEGCANKPVISGAQPIAGWASYSGNIYVADLSAGANAGRFTGGVNQLFRNGQRLTLGRWPNLNPDGSGGYSTADAQPSGNQLTDNELPTGNWAGAVIHIKTIRWLLVNRQVIGSSGKTLTLNDPVNCWGGACTGWGYFINNHLNTLDQDGEWYYDASAHRVYLYSASGAPTNIEGSVVLDGNADYDDFKPLFGMGLYIDNYSKDVEVSGNTIISTTVTGILYQRSTGWIRNNTVYNGSSGTMYSGLVDLAETETSVAELSRNALYGLNDKA